MSKIKSIVPKNFNRLVLVGEAYGSKEKKLNKPFVGPSGILLHKLLVVAKIKPEQCFITNVFMQQPPKNNVLHFYGSKKMYDKSMILPKYEHERIRLFVELAKLRPSVVIALGQTAINTLSSSNKPKINQLMVCGVGMVVRMHHPRYLLYKQKQPEFTQALRTLKFARQLAKRLAITGDDYAYEIGT